MEKKDGDTRIFPTPAQVMTEASVSRVARGSQLEPMVGPPNPGSFKVMGFCWMDGVYIDMFFFKDII